MKATKITKKCMERYRAIKIEYNQRQPTDDVTKRVITQAKTRLTLLDIPNISSLKKLVPSGKHFRARYQENQGIRQHPPPSLPRVSCAERPRRIGAQGTRPLEGTLFSRGRETPKKFLGHANRSFVTLISEPSTKRRYARHSAPTSSKRPNHTSWDRTAPNPRVQGQGIDFLRTFHRSAIMDLRRCPSKPPAQHKLPKTRGT